MRGNLSKANCRTGKNREVAWRVRGGAGAYFKGEGKTDRKHGWPSEDCPYLGGGRSMNLLLKGKGRSDAVGIPYH